MKEIDCPFVRLNFIATIQLPTTNDIDLKFGLFQSIEIFKIVLELGKWSLKFYKYVYLQYCRYLFYLYLHLLKSFKFLGYLKMLEVSNQQTQTAIKKLS